MTCIPSQIAPPKRQAPARVRIRTQLEELLQAREIAASTIPCPPEEQDAALATALMDVYRRTRDPDVFEGLVRWVGPDLRARVRSRVRVLGVVVDPEEVVQDAIVNIYKYPDRFEASRPRAFAAWSTTIADNAIRRHLRTRRREDQVCLRDPELIVQRADESAPEPSRHAAAREECSAAASAFALMLRVYLQCFRALSERERTVLEMIEVVGLRYAELAERMGVRADSLKMVVFRARKRLHSGVEQVIGSHAAGRAEAARSATV